MIARLAKVTVPRRGTEYRYRRLVSQGASFLASHSRPRDATGRNRVLFIAKSGFSRYTLQFIFDIL
jgi:hypothetical protein